jgi:hypothetical protein
MYWEDAREFAEAISGELGLDEQELAFEWAEESGLMDEMLAEAEQAGYEDEGEDDYYDQDAHIEGEMVAGLEDELARLERAIGRNLTQAEERSLLESIPSQAWHEGAVPDFTGAHAERLKGRASESKESRIALMAEAADTAKAEAEAERPGHDGSEPDWMKPGGGDGSAEQDAAASQ